MKNVTLIPVVAALLMFSIQSFAFSYHASSHGNPKESFKNIKVNSSSNFASSKTFKHVLTSIPNAVNVGTGQTYTSLTGPGGLFAALNAGSISANTIATITSNLTEPGTNTLNLITEVGTNAGTLTLTIQSDGISRVISGTAVASSAPMISITGAKRVTIDGGSGKLLTFRNTNSTASNTGPVFQFNSTSQNDILTNCYIESNSTSSANGVITIGTNGINDVTISSCDIRDARGGTSGYPKIGIYSNSVNNTLTITNNNIYNLTNAHSYAMFLNSVANGCIISGNSIYIENGVSALGDFTGIYIISTYSHTISGNYIGGTAPCCGGINPFTLSGNGTFTGILNNNTAPGGTIIQGNTIQNISMTNTGAPVFIGINNTCEPVTISGNVIGSPTTSNSITIDGIGISSGIIQSTITTSSACLFESNTIANITLSVTSNSPTFYGMKMKGGTVRKNKIFNIGSSVAATTPTIIGIYAESGLTTNEYSNNVISLNGGVSGKPALRGFWDTSVNTNTTGFYLSLIHI